jgi:hypothetical protein
MGMAPPGITPSFNINAASSQGTGLMNPAALPVSLPPIPPPSALVSPSIQAAAPQGFPTPPTLPEVPPPHMVAPYLYAQFPKPSPPQVFQPPTPPPAQPPPASQQPAPPQAAPVERKTKPAPPKVDKGVLSDEVIKRLNDRLNSEDAMTRMDAAGDLMALMQRNPELSSDPTYGPIIDAFADKIMADPSEMVRMPGLMIYQLGLDKTPTQFTMKRLQELSKQQDNDPLTPDTGEADMASQIVTQLSDPAAATPEPKEKSLTGQASEAEAGADPQQASPAAGAASVESAAPSPEVQPTPSNPAQAQPLQPPTTGALTTVQHPGGQAALSGNQLDLTSQAQQMGSLPSSPQQIGQQLNLREGLAR